MGIIDDLKWRYATKTFDADKKVSDADIETLKQALQLSPSSYGLQLYKFIIISNYDLKVQLKSASFGQSQIVDCSHLFVLCSYADISDDHIDEFAKIKSEVQGIDTSKYGDFIKQNLSSKTTSEKQNWMAHQVYIALGNLLTVCANLKIDTCPIEGFSPHKYNEILELPEKELNAIVTTAVGYRSTKDESQYKEKARKPLQSLFEELS